MDRTAEQTLAATLDAQFATEIADLTALIDKTERRRPRLTSLAVLRACDEQLRLDYHHLNQLRATRKLAAALFNHPAFRFGVRGPQYRVTASTVAAALRFAVSKAYFLNHVSFFCGADSVPDFITWLANYQDPRW